MQAERKPVEASLTPKNAKKRHLRRHTRKGWAFPQFPRGNPGDSGGIGGIGGIDGLARLIARMKNLRSHRALLRVEFSFGITSHKNYYVNSRVKNEETSAFEAN